MIARTHAAGSFVLNGPQAQDLAFPYGKRGLGVASIRALLLWVDWLRELKGLYHQWVLLSRILHGKRLSKKVPERRWKGEFSPLPGQYQNLTAACNFQIPSQAGKGLFA
jgi:hypothetical protein